MSALRFGVIGVGTAGRARARAIQGEGHVVTAVWRGRYAASLGVPVAPGFDAVVATSDVVAICSPSEVHAAQVEAVLDAGRHVVVEYPLARTGEEAEALLSLARARGLVLHVAHIERLAGTTTVLAREIAAAERIEGASTAFFSEGPPWPDASVHAWTNLSRLHRVDALFDGIVAADVEVADGGAMHGTLHTGRGPVAFAWGRGPHHVRHLAVEVSLDGVRWCVEDRRLLREGEPVVVPHQGLFAHDTRVAAARVLTGAPSYVDDGLLIRMLRWTDAIGAAVGRRVSPLRA